MKNYALLISLFLLYAAPLAAQIPPLVPQMPGQPNSALPSGAPPTPVMLIPQDMPYRSIMYTSEELAVISEMIAAYQPAQPKSEVKSANTPQLAPEQQQSTLYTFPQFFLSSIIYYRPDHWSVWLNNERITQASPESGNNVTVVEVTPKTATFVWTPSAQDKVQWMQSGNPLVIVNEIGGNITFTLRSNQTFSSYQMNIIEGKVQPAVIDAAQYKKTVAPDITPTNTVPITPPPPPPALTPLTPSKDTGFEGLLNRYNDIP